MKKTIRRGDNLGIAKQVQGKIVDAVPDTTYSKNGWKFEYYGETWLASDYAFEETNQK